MPALIWTQICPPSPYVDMQILSGNASRLACASTLHLLKSCPKQAENLLITFEDELRTSQGDVGGAAAFSLHCAV